MHEQETVTLVNRFFFCSISAEIHNRKLHKDMSQLSYYTEEGLKKLKDKLLFLTTKGRKEMSKQIAEARDKGDLSENAEYDAAKDAG